MTEKRFQYNVNKNSIEYDDKHFAYCNVEQSKIAKKLNELNYEIIELHIQNDFLKDENQHMRDLVNENEQLKKDIEKLSEIIDDNIPFGRMFSDRDLNDICNEMGWELSEKGVKLNQLEKENEQLKQFQDSVFSWIDMHLQRLPTLRDDEFESDNEFADPSLYSGAIQILETMKIELKEDVE